LGYENKDVIDFKKLNDKAQQFLRYVRKLTKVPIKYAFTGKDNQAVIRNFEIKYPLTF
jgi:adenylosuccinate synthase